MLKSKKLLAIVIVPILVFGGIVGSSAETNGKSNVAELHNDIVIRHFINYMNNPIRKAHNNVIIRHLNN